MTRRLALIQGIYFTITGFWPVLHMPSFELITGPKQEHWLVKSVGALIGVIGVGLIAAERRGEVTPSTALIATSSAAALTTVDVVYYTRGVLGWIYLADAALESGLIAAWSAALAMDRD